MMEFCTRLEFPFSKNLESDRKRLQQENITLYWLSWSANLFSWKYNSHLPRPLSCSERKTVWLKISIIYIQRVTLTLTWLGTLAEVKWKWNMIVKREIRSFNDRLKQWNTVNNYENSLVALDNMQQNGSAVYMTTLKRPKCVIMRTALHCGSCICMSIVFHCHMTFCVTCTVVDRQSEKNRFNYACVEHLTHM